MSKLPERPQRRQPTRGDRLSASARLGEPGHLGSGVRRALAGWLGRFLRRWFRPTLEGVEHLPSKGPFLVVANHSGAGNAETLILAYLWNEHFGTSRPLAGMAHPVGFHVPVFGDLVRGLGAIPSSYEAALGTLAAGVPVLVFPGGDHEAFRPIWQRHEVDFAGRKGFLRIAHAAGVPVVPVGIRGSHVTVPIFWRSRLLPWLLVLPRLVGIKRLPVTVVGVFGAILIALLAASVLGWAWTAIFAAAWLAGPLPLVIFFPSAVRIRIGAPITPETFSVEVEEVLEAALETVEGAVRRLVQSS